MGYLNRALTQRVIHFIFIRVYPWFLLFNCDREVGPAEDLSDSADQI